MKILNIIPPPRAAGENPPPPEKENPELLAQLPSLVPANARRRFGIEAEIIESADAAEGFGKRRNDSTPI